MQVLWVIFTRFKGCSSLVLTIWQGSRFYRNESTIYKYFSKYLDYKNFALCFTKILQGYLCEMASNIPSIPSTSTATEFDVNLENLTYVVSNIDTVIALLASKEDDIIKRVSAALFLR